MAARRMVCERAGTKPECGTCGGGTPHGESAMCSIVGRSCGSDVRCVPVEEARSTANVDALQGCVGMRVRAVDARGGEVVEGVLRSIEGPTVNGEWFVTIDDDRDRRYGFYASTVDVLPDVRPTSQPLELRACPSCGHLMDAARGGDDVIDVCHTTNCPRLGMVVKRQPLFLDELVGTRVVVRYVDGRTNSGRLARASDTEVVIDSGATLVGLAMSSIASVTAEGRANVDALDLARERAALHAQLEEERRDLEEKIRLRDALKSFATGLERAASAKRGCRLEVRIDGDVCVVRVPGARWRTLRWGVDRRLDGVARLVRSTGRPVVRLHVVEPGLALIVARATDLDPSSERFSNIELD